MPETQYDVSINLKTTDKTSAPTGKAAKTIGLLTKAAAAAAVALGALKAAQGAVNFLKLGNDVEAAEHQFKAFAGGTQQAKDYLDAFNRGALNTVDRFTAMSAAGKMLGMGLVKNTSEMELMTSIATQMGDSTATAGENIENFGLLLANQSVARLDSFKIASGEARRRIDELKQSGMDAEEAFKMTVLDMGAERLKTLGNTADLGKTKFAQFTSTLKNTRDMMALAFSKVVNATGVLEWMTKVVEKLPGYFNQAGKWIIDSLSKVTITVLQMYATVKGGIVWLVEWVKTGFNVAKANDAMRVSMEKSVATIDKTNAWFDGIKEAWKEYENSIMAAAETTEIGTGRIMEANARVTGSASAGQKGQFIQTQLAKMRPMQERMRAAGSSWAHINEQMAAFQANTFKQADQLYGEGGSNPTFASPTGRGGGSSTTNNSTTFNQTVNTNASQANVQQDFALAQALAG